MRNIFLKKLYILVLLLSFVLIVGCDGKKPESGYISKEEFDSRYEIVGKIKRHIRDFD